MITGETYGGSQMTAIPVRILGAFCAVLLLTGSFVAPAQARDGKWTMHVSVRSDGIFTAEVENGRITRVKRTLPRPYILRSSSRKHVSADRQDSLNLSIFRVPKIKLLDTLYSFTGQRTVVGISGNSAIILQTNPNGENADVRQKSLSWGDERVLGNIDLLDETTGNYGWIETDVSSPYGKGPVYFGAQERRPIDAGSGRGYGFTIYQVRRNGAPVPFQFIDSAPYNGYINDFCVSPSGRRVAFQNSLPGGSLGQEQLHVLDRASGRVWSTQTSSGSLGASCFINDDALVVSGAPPVLMTLTGSGIKRSKIRGHNFSDLVNGVEIVR